MLVRPGFEPATSRSADQRPPNWANRVIHSQRTSPHFFISKYILACLCCRGPIIYGTLMAMISSSPSVFAFMEQLMGRTHLKMSDSSFEICLVDVLTRTIPSNSKCWKTFTPSRRLYTIFNSIRQSALQQFTINWSIQGYILSNLSN